MRSRSLVGIAIAVAVATLFVFVHPATSAPRASASGRRVDAPPGLADLLQSRASRIDAVKKHRTALPTWTGAFASGGTSYSYTMVGTDPAAGSETTLVPVRLLPLRLTFDGGITLDGTDTINDIRHSPVFRDADYRSGKTQYGDAMQRASFWDSVQSVSPKYHVLLSEPTVLPTVSLQVPADSGSALQTANGPRGTISTPWLFSQAPTLLSNYYDPASLLIIVVKDVTGEDFLGFHFALTPPNETVPMTFIFTGYFTSGNVVPDNRADSYVLSHEVTEWINDPYVTNYVPAWRDPFSGQCFNGLLETGDPVEFFPNPSFTVTTNGRQYHVTDMAGISWFAHDVPSRELGGDYSYNGTLTSYSTLC